MKRLTFTVLATLALLHAAAPFATDMYLPAFPQMVRDLQTSPAGVQFSLTAFMLGAAVGQFVFGPISDRVGRMKPLLIGGFVYVLSGIAAMLAPSLGVLIAARLIQGATGAAGMVICRAIITDMASGREAARAMSLMMLIGGVAPVVAPVAGSLLADPLGWRGIMGVVVGLSALALICSVVFLRESHPAEKRNQAGTDREALRPLLGRKFAGNALAYAFSFAVMMAYISASPFLYQELMGMGTIQYGLLFGLNATLLAVVGAVSAKLTNRLGPVLLARIGLFTNLAAAAAIAGLVAVNAPAVWLCLPIMVAVASLGFVFGNTTALALEQVPRASGTGSAVIGVLQFTLAAIVAPLVGINSTAVPMAVVMLAASVLACASFLAAGQREPELVAAKA
ncbi:MAG: multidrug effflux MFS transporter [Propionibacteriaceae bacterium]|nr:multidrug effflux MFS transporter [Propionibacteriaceae bacterium]